MAIVASKGLGRVREIYQDRPHRVRELQAEGKKVIGYLCLYPVLEMMTALDLVPYRMFGDMREPITRADTYIARTICPFLRSLLDLGLKGKYDFLDGIVFAHACDGGARLIATWLPTVKPSSYFRFIDTPHTTHEPAQKQLKQLLKDFQKSLESYTGKELSSGRLKEAIDAHNQQRALVRELYDLRKPDPPFISGTETLQVMKALMSLPVGEGTKLLGEVISEVKQRKNGVPKKPARLLIWGPVIDDIALIEMIESLDANVVMDDTCVGSRAYFADAKLTNDPLDGLAYHYLVDLKCPRTFRENIRSGSTTAVDYMTNMKNRFSYLGDYAREWKTNGAVLEVMRFCDGHGFEAPWVKDYLDSIGLPSVFLEHDYSEASLAPLRTRVQGLIEVITG